MRDDDLLDRMSPGPASIICFRCVAINVRINMVAVSENPCLGKQTSQTPSQVKARNVGI
jgi:hypothetical protein